MNDLSELECRLHSLERRNGLLLASTVATLSLLGLAACTAMTAATTHDVLTVSRLQIVDADGKPMIELGPDMDGYGLSIRDGAGKVRISLRDVAEETGLFINDAAGDSRVGVAHFSHGGSGVALHGPEVRGAAVLYYKDRGSLSFYDPDGAVTHQVP